MTGDEPRVGIVAAADARGDIDGHRGGLELGIGVAHAKKKRGKPKGGRACARYRFREIHCRSKLLLRTAVNILRGGEKTLNGVANGTNFAREPAMLE